MTDTLPRLGIRLHGGLSPAECVALARAAEAAGLAAVWFAENPFGRGVLPAAAAAAAATRLVRIGIGVFNPFNRHPSLMAMEIGALDELAGGRAALGIGSGIAEAVERMGFASDRPLAAVGDAIRIVRAMLAGETVDHAGRAFSVEGVRLDYGPTRPDLPILMAARGPQSLALCGRIADGVMLSNMCSPAFAADAVAAVGAAARRAGRAPPGEAVQYVPCALRRDRADAVREMKRALGPMVSSFWALGAHRPAARAAMLCGSGIEDGEFASVVAALGRGEEAAQVLDDRFMRAFGIAGTAEDCLEQAAVYRWAGITELGLTFIGASPADDIAALGQAVAAMKDP